jgi:hypothetical protein
MCTNRPRELVGGEHGDQFIAAFEQDEVGDWPYDGDQRFAPTTPSRGSRADILLKSDRG